MLGVEGYGSDSDNGSDSESMPKTSSTSQSSSLTSKLPPPSKKTSFSLPPPSNATASSSKPSSGLTLPPPKSKRAPKKITIGLPSLPRDNDDEHSDTDERPAAKRPRLETGAGASALLSMLPAPKNKDPTPAAPERVLGGGRGPGLVFKSAPSQPNRNTTVENADDSDDGADPAGTLDVSVPAILEEVPSKKPPLPFMPTSVSRGKANISVEEKHSVPVSRPLVSAAPAVDFFSLGSSTAPPLAGPSKASTASTQSSHSAPPLFSAATAAPKIDDFTPPEPTRQDPYPGYYILPSGQWAQYDVAYYQKFCKKWRKEYDDYVRAIEKGTVKGFEGAEEEAEEVNAFKEMERAKEEIQAREERKALTTAPTAPAAPKMNIKGAALGGRARTRHQLSTLLTEAYTNREALEEKIAQGRRNRKEAGNKYGF